MGSAGTVTASARVGDIGVGRVEAASCRTVEEVTFEEDLRAAIIEVTGPRTFDMDDCPHRCGRDANDPPSLIECGLSHRLTWSDKIHHILPQGPELGVASPAPQSAPGRSARPNAKVASKRPWECEIAHTQIHISAA